MWHTPAAVSRRHELRCGQHLALARHEARVVGAGALHRPCPLRAALSPPHPSTTVSDLTFWSSQR